MIYFDIDGVLRALNSITHNNETITKWDQKNEDGENVIEAVNNDKTSLLRAPKTKYCNIILDFIVDNGLKLNLLSAQPNSWRDNTDTWIEDNVVKHSPYFEHVKPDITYVHKPDQKLDIINEKDAVIVEDYPLFDDYSRIILIDYVYNRAVKKPIKRVRSTEQLVNVLEEYV